MIMATVATKALLVVAMVAAALGTALGATYTVGAPGGSWDLRTNYAQWTSNIKFHAGDQLVFEYSRAADYDACSGSSPISSFQTGSDIVPLATAGSRYFICGVPGHCDSGMKVRVNVEAAPGGRTSASPPLSTPERAPAAATAPSAGAPAAGGQKMPPSSSATSLGVGSVVGFGSGAIFAAGLVVSFSFS